jgi:RND family efflux transporter MFP subunit
VGSPVDGRVTDVHIEAGDSVEMENPKSGDNQYSGKPIVQLSTETVSVEIAAATAELTRLEHELQELETGNRPEEVTRAKAKWEAVKAALDLAESQLKRAESLRRSNAISAEDFETARSAALTAKQDLIAAAADYELTNAGPRSEQIAQAVAKVSQQKQEVARLNILRQYHIIRAPFGGHVVQKHTEVGQWLNRGDPVAEIVALDPIDVIVHVPESLVNQLEIGNKVPLHVAALPEGLEALQGTIHGIGPSADQRARTFPVRIRLRNPVRDGNHLLRDGMQARAVIPGTPRSTLLISKDALILGGPTPVVMIASPKDDGLTVAVQVDVETGVALGSTIEVLGDLQAGQQVIVDGNERIRAGQVLRVINRAQAADKSFRVVRTIEAGE